MEENVPKPVLFNCWKHHEGFLIQKIFAVKNKPDLESLIRNLKKIGSSTTDLYTGGMSLSLISDKVIELLKKNNLFDKIIYLSWIAGSGEGYRTIDLPDQSNWVLKKGNEDNRYIHIHPGRNVPHTIRVKANVLKTAIAVNSLSRIEKRNPMDIEIINKVRNDFLGLSPIKFITMNQELGRMIYYFGKRSGTID